MSPLENYKLVYEELGKPKQTKEQFKMTDKQIESAGIWIANAILLAFIILGRFMG